jgi:hypothetical protein
MDVHCITFRLATVKYIPGLAFKKQAEAWKARVPDWVDRAFDGFKANMAKIISRMILPPNANARRIRQPAKMLKTHCAGL